MATTANIVLGVIAAAAYVFGWIVLDALTPWGDEWFEARD